jgi:hypothetical protein
MRKSGETGQKQRCTRTRALEIKSKPAGAADCRPHSALLLAGILQACAHVGGSLQMRLVDIAFALSVIEDDDACSLNYTVHVYTCNANDGDKNAAAQSPPLRMPPSTLHYHQVLRSLDR